MKYFHPIGWKGYALNVTGKYDKGNDDWLKNDGNINQCILFIMELIIFLLKQYNGRIQTKRLKI